MADLLQDAYAATKVARDEREAETKCAVAEKNTEAPVGPIHARLRSDIANLEGQIQRSWRAAQILSAHPEFELLIELLGLISVDIRTRPVQAQRALVLE